MTTRVIQGDFYTATGPTTVELHPQALICIDDQGMIERIVEQSATDYAQVVQHAQQADRLLKAADGQVILPGFVDLHVHAPQWPNAGLALDLPLEDWLQHYTFPLEAKYCDPAFASQVYPTLVKELLNNGTTTVLFFGTIHNQDNLILAQECLKQGLRSLIGRVAMDNPDQTPEYYRDHSSQAALADTEAFIRELTDLGRGEPLAPTPVITPRFVPSCTDETLAGLGQLARHYDLPIQSHLSESKWEHQYAIERFGKHDAEVLDQFGLLTDKAVMAHATQLTAADQQLVRDRSTALAHCPISNVYFGSGIMPVKTLLHDQIKVGLGTDISGGYSPSLYDNLRQAVMSSQIRQDGVGPESAGVDDSRISMKTAFYLATVGGGRSLHLPIGEIKPGFQADLQIVQERFVEPTDDSSNRLERLLYQTHRADVKRVIVNGVIVK
ncbi:guanine deaminase [Limosilactobacillus caecicola]|uniref:guanine deaminase n=1 Tax=Limosilactobacillus caecicola TaxID=2941332 RepID=UPI002041035C|nr:guanine deaminase [Limosilactobacillus caecicola]